MFMPKAFNSDNPHTRFDPDNRLYSTDAVVLILLLFLLCGF